MDKDTRIAFDADRARILVGLAKTIQFAAFAALVAAPNNHSMRSWQFWAQAGGIGVVGGASEWWAQRLKSEIAQAEKSDPSPSR